MDNPIQIGINTDPSDSSEGPGENQCLVEDFYWPVQDANFNVLGLVASDGTLHERYEYTPYGERTVYKRAGSADEKTSAPLYESGRVNTGTEQDPEWAPYGLCDFGHQGLFFDKEFGQYDNRGRMYLPRAARFLNRDPAGYADGMSLYEYCGSGPLGLLDPFGLISREDAKKIQRFANDYNFAEKARRGSERAAAIAESTAERLEKGAKAAERLGNLAEKKRLRGAAEKMRDAAEECRQAAERAGQLAEEIAWQGKIAIERAEWAERGTTGSGGGSKWTEKWYNDKWYEGKDLNGVQPSAWEGFCRGADAGAASVLDAMTLHQVDAFHQAADQMWAKTSLGDTWVRKGSEVSGYVSLGGGAAALALEGAAYLGISAIGTVGLSDLPNQVATELYTFGATGSPFAYKALTSGTGSTTTFEVVQVRSSLGADGSTSMIVKTKSMETGETLRVVHRVLDTTGRVIHEDVKFRK